MTDPRGKRRSEANGPQGIAIFKERAAAGKQVVDDQYYHEISVTPLIAATRRKDS
jgi:hypothetical protein